MPKENLETAPEERSRLERFGLWLLRRQADARRAATRTEAEDEVHELNPSELKELRRISYAAIARAGLIGALSALAVAFAELYATPWLGPDPDAASYEQTIRYWALVGAVTVIAAALEIAFLYWDALRAVYQLADAAGLKLFAEGEDDEIGEMSEAVALSMARAALELPNPQKGRFGLDPHRETNRLYFLFVSLLYKAKIGVTNFLIKALLRRLMGRALVRVWLVFVGVPVTALWNALVCYRVLREARLRAMGPSAARAFFQGVTRNVALTENRELGVALLSAVGSTVVRTHDLHPNLDALLTEVGRATGLDPGRDLDIDDSAAFLTMVGAQPSEHQTVILATLIVAAVVDGRITRDERALLDNAYAAAGRICPISEIKALRRAFVRGKVIRTRDILGLAGGR